MPLRPLRYQCRLGLIDMDGTTWNNSSDYSDNDDFTLKDLLPSEDNLIDEIRLDHFLNSLGLENSEKEFLTMKFKNYTMEYIQDNLTDTSIYKVKKSLRHKYKEGE